MITSAYTPTIRLVSYPFQHVVCVDIYRTCKLQNPF